MRLTLLFLGLLTFICSSSQDSIFHIKDYKFRTPGYKALALNINVSGNYNNRNQGSSNLSRSNSTSIGPISANYYHIRSSEKRFQQSNISFSSDYSSFSQKDGSEKRMTRNNENSAMWSLQTRDYRGNQWFFEWGNEIRGSLEVGRTQTNFFHTQTADYTIQNTATIGFGKGRIEWVQDAQMAVFILQDMASQNLLNRTPSAAETNAFAELVTDINNRRVFDNRRRRIYELSRIDSFLKNSGLVAETDIRHFTTINDNWAFAINPFRQSGSAWFVRVAPGVRFQRNNVSDKLAIQPFLNQASHLSFYFSPEIGYEKYWPISLNWQTNFKISASYNGERYFNKMKETRRPGSTEVEHDWYSGYLGLNVNYGLGFFPNTRTQLTGDIGLYALYANEGSWDLRPTFNFSARYFIGYRTYLNGDLSTIYQRSAFGTENNNLNYDFFSGGFAIRLTHFLF